jgi:hypothetical protein
VQMAPLLPLTSDFTFEDRTVDLHMCTGTVGEGVRVQANPPGSGQSAISHTTPSEHSCARAMTVTKNFSNMSFESFGSSQTWDSLVRYIVHDEGGGWGLSMGR